MQINNNIHSTSFGMALKIRPEAKKNLAGLSGEVLDGIKKAGLGELKDTKFYHVLVDGEGAKIVSDKSAYFGPVNNSKYYTEFGYIGREKSENILMLKSKSPNETMFGIHKLGTPDKATGDTRYNTWTYASLNNYTDVPELARYAKIMDDIAVENYEKTLINNQIASEQRVLGDKGSKELLDLFGV